MNTILKFIVVLITTSLVWSQTTTIPDANFEQKLIDLGHDTVLDGSVSTTTVARLDSLNVGNSDISDLTGIEAFTALTFLVVENNNLDSLNVSSNILLTQLYAHNNDLTFLDVSENVVLTTLFVEKNELDTLDVISNVVLTMLYANDNALTSLNVNANVLLTQLGLHNNALTSLDVSSNIVLTHLSVFNNDLTTLDVSQNNTLSSLYAGGNQLTTLDLSANTSLTELYLANNQLASLNISTNTLLIDLSVYNNALTNLDVSTNTALELLNVSRNQLTDLDISENTSIELLVASENEGLTCILVAPNTFYNFDIDENQFLSETTCSIDLVLGELASTFEMNENSDLEIALTATSSPEVPFMFNAHVLHPAMTENDNLYPFMVHIIHVELGDNDNSVADTLHLESLNNWSGIAEVEIVVHNEYGDVDKDTIFVTVHPQLVLAELDDLEMNEDSDLLVELTATSTNNLPLIFDAHVLSPIFDEETEDGSLYFMAHVFHDTEAETDTLHLESLNDWYGTAEVEIVVHNMDGGLDKDTILVVVNQVDDTLVLGNLGNLELDEDTELKVELTATSTDDEPSIFHAYVLSPSFDDMENNQPLFMAYVIHDGLNQTDTIHFQALNNWFGLAEVEISVQNEDGLQDIDTVFVTVNSVDDEPIVDGQIQYIEFMEDFSQTDSTEMDFNDWVINLDSVFFDIDGELEYSVYFTDTTIVAAHIDTQMLSLHSLDNAFGETHMILTASNPIRASVSDTVVVLVIPVNDAPMFSTSVDTIVLDESSSYEMMSFQEMMDDGTLTDVDNSLEELTFDIHADGPNVHVEWNGMTSTRPVLVAHENYNGPALVTLCAYDGEDEACFDYDVMVNPVNDAPMFTSVMHRTVGLDLEFHIRVNVEDNDSDSLFLSIVADSSVPEWLSIIDGRLHGTPTELGDFPVVLSLTDGETVVEDTLYLHVVNFNPEIIEVADVPNDQGGRVYLAFTASFQDNGEVTGQSYSVFRMDTQGDTSAWVGVQSLDAVGEDHYIYEVTTLADSSVNGPSVTSFMVIASMHDGIFASMPMMGYSLDNILPGVPRDVMATLTENTLELSWNENMDEDFQYFIIEKSYMDDIDGLGMVEFIETTDAFYVDQNYVSSEEYYYRIAAVDHAGNQSEFSEYVEVSALAIDDELTPNVFALHQNYPNPFNPTTQINYDLPTASIVQVTIYDVMGRVVRDLLSESQDAGFHSLQWNATNNIGEVVSAGMYIYTIQAGSHLSTKKMVLLK